MKYILQTIDKSYLIRLYRGEDILESLQKFCKYKHDIGSGRIQGLGAVSQIKLGYFSGTEYFYMEYRENLEILSLSGNIADNQIIHLHGVFSRKDGSCIGGHVFQGCVVSATCEVQILVLKPNVSRIDDPQTKLKLLDLPNEIDK